MSLEKSPQLLITNEGHTGFQGQLNERKKHKQEKEKTPSGYFSLQLNQTYEGNIIDLIKIKLNNVRPMSRRVPCKDKV